MTPRNSRLIALALTAALAAPCAAPANADPIEDFYKAKGLRIMLGHPPGGSYDFYARLAADHLRRFLPGVTTVILEHKPGGGGVVATGWFYANAPRDGSIIGLFPETTVHTQLLEPNVGRWKAQEMTWLGSFAPVNPAFVVRKGAPATTAEKMRDVRTVIGCTGRNSQSYQYPAMLKALAGFKFELVCGYKGSSDSVMAMERGEVDLVSSAWNSWRVTHAEGIRKGDFIVAIQGGLRRDKELPDTPLMQELVTDPQTRRIIEFASAGAAIGRALLAPPKVPQERIDALRAAFDKMVVDKEFLADAERRHLVIDPDSGANIQKVADAILATPADLVAAAANAMK